MKNGPDFSIEQYKACIDELGLKKTQKEILKTASETDSVSEIIQARNFSELYEFGVAYISRFTLFSSRQHHCHLHHNLRSSRHLPNKIRETHFFSYQNILSVF